MKLKSIKKSAKTLLSWTKRRKKYIIFGFYIVFCSIAITLLMGYVERYGVKHPVSETFIWMRSSVPAFVINCLIIVQLMVFFWLISRKLTLSALIVSSLMIIFSLINHFKLTIRGEPIYPGDLLFSGEATNIVGATKLIVPRSIIVFIGIAIVIVIVSFFIDNPRLTLKKRFISMTIILAIWVISFPLYFANSGVQHTLGIVDAIWNQKHNYLENGPLNSFLMQTKYLIVSKPKGYNKKIAERLLEDNATSSINNNTPNNNTPNVIVLMSESFWDPTRLPGVSYDIDPMESFRKIQNESIHGDILVEPFGGNTANSEFEALTGLSMHALPGGVAYQQYVKREIPSLASLLKDQGYTTQAIHPYEEWFWNRKVVYPLIGIDKFMTKTSFSKDDHRGEYISDNALTKKIISEYEASKPGGKPFFAHAVSMQNHGWHNPGRYGKDQVVHSSSKDLDKKSLEILDTYAQGCKDASDSLLELVDYFKNTKEPTQIIFFGDHLPTLVGDYGVYRKTKYVGKGELTDDDLRKLHTTPFLIWDSTKSKSRDIGTINTNYLSPTMLKNAGMKMSSYFEFLDSKMGGVKACNKKVCLNEKDKYESRNNSDLKAKLNDQAIIQYYYLFDKK